MINHRTPEQIRTAGIAALKRELGTAGMIRFLQQFDPGHGDWATQRREWVDNTSLASIQKLASSRRKPRRH